MWPNWLSSAGGGWPTHNGMLAEIMANMSDLDVTSDVRYRQSGTPDRSDGRRRRLRSDRHGHPWSRRGDGDLFMGSVAEHACERRRVRS